MTRKTHLTAQHTKPIPRLTLDELFEVGIVRMNWKPIDAPDSGRVVHVPTVRDGFRSAGYSVGYSVNGAAKELSISRQRVHQLVLSGVLEAFELIDDAQCPAGLFITPASLMAFKSTDRTPGRKPSRKKKEV